jgi:GNAT superfamily N-acetyltransferase
MSHLVPPLEIVPTTGHDLAPTLLLAFGNLGTREQAHRVENLVKQYRRGDLSLDGTFQARRDRQLVGSIFSHLREDGTAVIWPPCLMKEEPPETMRALLEATFDYCREKECRVAMLLHDRQADPEPTWLPYADSSSDLELVYLLAGAERFPSAPPESEIEFVPFQRRDLHRMAELVEQTYEGSRDCPELNGICRTGDVVAGYQKLGKFRPEHWYFVQYLKEDIGCLLLNDQPQGDHLELVYMGLVPSARGRGWSHPIVKQAFWTARCASRHHVLVSVDARNTPALQAYRRAGFSPCDRKKIYLRFF